MMVLLAESECVAELAMAWRGDVEAIRGGLIDTTIALELK